MDDIKTKYHFDASANKDVIERVQDCEPIIQEIQEKKQFTDGRGDTSLGYHVGRIPGIIVEQYIKQVGITFHEFCIDPTHIHRIMNNPDYKKFRVFEGKIGNGNH